jgi:hypothetical protein
VPARSNILEYMSVLLAGLIGCSELLTFGFPTATPEQYAAASEAAQEWRAACGVDVELSRERGAVRVIVVPAEAIAPHGGWYHADATGERIEVSDALATEPTIYAHEMGHALGFEHTASGIMFWNVPVGTRVTASDCP